MPYKPGSGITSTGGTFKNDEKMPLFSGREFDAAFQYLSLKIDIHDAQEAQSPTVITDGRSLPLHLAKIECDKLRTAFEQVVREETLASDPNATKDKIESRRRDIINAMMDTSYVSETHRAR